MNVAYVIVRYGPEVVGGAELGCRMLAERLGARPGWSVEVFTTCALESSTWADHFSPGTTDINGVTVHRFVSERGRDRRFAKRVVPVDEPSERQLQWIDWQGPVCPAVLEGASASPADLVIFYPYLYWPTVHGIPLVAERAVLHPAAHDEPALQLGIFARTFALPRGFVFQTDSERRLVEARFPSVTTRPQLRLGLGVADGVGAAADDAFTKRYGLEGVPFLLCLGRVDEAKGAPLLARFFLTYKTRRPGPLKLVFAGPVVDAPPAHPDVVVTGPLSEAMKWSALRAATALVSPSPFEAFSIVLMEAWTAGRPVLVHGRAQATLEHVRRSGGGLAFHGYADFETEVDRLVADGALRETLGEAGRRYVEANFSWDRLIERYANWLERLT